MPKHAPICPHDPLEAIGGDVFMVRGSIRLNPLVRITRSMAIVRHLSELTLVNPIRLNAEGEEQLRSLGEIRRIMRLGSLHGIDDRATHGSFLPGGAHRAVEVAVEKAFS